MNWWIVWGISLFVLLFVVAYIMKKYDYELWTCIPMFCWFILLGFGLYNIITLNEKTLFLFKITVVYFGGFWLLFTFPVILLLIPVGVYLWGWSLAIGG